MEGRHREKSGVGALLRDFFVDGKKFFVDGHIEFHVHRLGGLPNRSIAFFDCVCGIDHSMDEHPVVKINSLANVAPIGPEIMEGLDGDSIQSIFVLGRMAAATAFTSLVST